jgi:hypothetical protein
MSKKKTNISEDQHDVIMGKAVHHMPAYRQAKCFDSISEEQHAALKVLELANLLWLTDKMSEDVKNLRIARAIDFYEGLAPQNAMETMLVLQMVATHSAALECISQAQVSGRFIDGLDILVKNSTKLMTLYTRQMDMLQKVRGIDQRQVIVKYIYDEPGAQATDGSLDTSAPKTAKPRKPKHTDAAEASGPALSLVSNVTPLPKDRPAPKPRAKRA